MPLDSLSFYPSSSFADYIINPWLPIPNESEYDEPPIKPHDKKECYTCWNDLDYSKDGDELVVEHEEDGHKHPVHLKCLQTWIETSHNYHCSYCKHPIDPDSVSSLINKERGIMAKIEYMGWKMGSGAFVVTAARAQQPAAHRGDYPFTYNNSAILIAIGSLAATLIPFNPHELQLSERIQRIFRRN